MRFRPFLILLLCSLALPSVALADHVSPLLEADAVSLPTPDLHAVTLAALEAPAPASSLAVIAPLATVEAPASSPVRTAVESLLVTVVLPGLGSLLTIALGFAALSLRRYLEERAKTSATARVATRLLHLAEVVVQELESTVKAEYEKAAADGKITADEAKHLKEVALQRLKSSLGEHGLEELQQVIGVAGGSLEQYLGGVVEAAVAKVSAQAAEPKVVTVPTLAARVISSP